MKKLMGDQDHIRENLFAYMQAFSPAVRDIFERFDFHTQIDRLAKAGLLYLVTEKFANIDLHPETVSNAQMGAVFEELIRKFAEISNETAGEHFTPREVIRLMVNLLFIEDDDVLTKPGVVRSIYDPTAGTGGMLSVAGEHLAEHEPRRPAGDVRPGTERRVLRHLQGRHADQGAGHRQHHLRQHAVERRPARASSSTTCCPIRRSAWSGRRSRRKSARKPSSRASTAASAPACRACRDGSLLFLLHLISKMRPAKDGGSRFGIVLNGSPLFTGGAGSGESEIRRYVLENDLVEAIIGLPTDMFYNTGISTYVWIVSNRKPAAPQGQGATDRRQQLLAEDAEEPGEQAQGTSSHEHIERDHHDSVRQDVRQEALTAAERQVKPHQPHLQERGLRLPHDHGRTPASGTRPARSCSATKGKLKGKPQPDANLRDTENVPLQRGRGNLLQARSAAARARCLDRPREDEGRLRNPVQPALLRLQAAARAGRDRRRIEGRHRPHPDDDRGAVEMSFPRYPKYKDSGVEWLGEVPEHWDVKRLQASRVSNRQSAQIPRSDEDTESILIAYGSTLRTAGH